MKTQGKVLIRSAVELYTLGMVLNGAEAELSLLDQQGFSLSSPELVAAAARHGSLSARWTAMERRHPRVRGA